MDATQFWATIAAVMIGNAASLAYVYAIWAGSRSEKEGKPMPFKVVFFGIAGPVICAASIFFTVNL